MMPTNIDFVNVLWQNLLAHYNFSFTTYPKEDLMQNQQLPATGAELLTTALKDIESKNTSMAMQTIFHLPEYSFDTRALYLLTEIVSHAGTLPKGHCDQIRVAATTTLQSWLTKYIIAKKDRVRVATMTLIDLMWQTTLTEQKNVYSAAYLITTCNAIALAVDDAIHWEKLQLTLHRNGNNPDACIAIANAMASLAQRTKDVAKFIDVSRQICNIWLTRNNAPDNWSRNDLRNFLQINSNLIGALTPDFMSEYFNKKGG